MWTVQEFVLAKNATFCLGPLEVSSYSLTTIALDSECMSAQDIRLLIHHRYQMMSKQSRLTLGQYFLNLARSRDCKDDRDRVNALLGIAEDTGITPDYSMSLQKVLGTWSRSH